MIDPRGLARIKVAIVLVVVVVLIYLFGRRPEVVIVGRWTRSIGTLRDFELRRGGHASVSQPALGSGSWDLHARVLRITLNDGQVIVLTLLDVHDDTLRVASGRQTEMVFSRVR